MPHNVSILLLNGIDKMVLWIQEYSISISFEQYTVNDLINQISKSEFDAMFQSILKIASFWNVMNLSIKMF